MGKNLPKPGRGIKGRSPSPEINCTGRDSCFSEKMFSVFNLLVQSGNILFPVPFPLYRIETAISAELAAKRDMYIYSCHRKLFQQQV